MKGSNVSESYRSTIDKTLSIYSNMPYSQEFSHFSRILSGTIADLQEDDIRSSGYVIHTLEAAIWCLLSTCSYEEAVLKAVNLGEDTDTTGIAENDGLRIFREGRER